MFSVVIPTYNRGLLLRGALESVWRQRYTDYEILVVDDGSTDETHDYLLGLGDRIRTITQTNRGPGAARNCGIRESKGDYVALLDSDDLWFPWTLDTFSKAIKEHEHPHVLGGNSIEFADEADLLKVREEPFDTSWFSDYFASSQYPYYVGSGTCVVRRDAFASARFLEDRLNAEDHDLVLQMGTLPGFVRIAAPVTLAWRRHAASETSNVASSASGTLRLMDREKAGLYPGGHARSRERRRILSRHIRPAALDCARDGNMKIGWKLFCSSIGWNLQLGHWKYVLGFPAVALQLLLRRLARRSIP